MTAVISVLTGSTTKAIHNGTKLDLSHSLVYFEFSHFNSLFIPCGRQSWLLVSFLLLVKYTLSYRIVSLQWPLTNPVPWQNWMAVYLDYTLRMKTLCCGWPILVHNTHTRRSDQWLSRHFYDSAVTLASLRVRELKLKTPLDIVTYSPGYKKISARGHTGGHRAP